MYISNEKIFIIGCGGIFLLTSILTTSIVSLLTTSYLQTFFSCFIILAIILGVILVLLSKKEWFKELTDYSYYRINHVLDLYKSEVIRNNKKYNRFIEDYFSENQWIKYSIDSQGSPNIPEIKAKNKIFNQIIDLLKNREDLIKKYSIKKSFRYSDFLNLINEYNTTNRPLTKDKYIPRSEASNPKYYTMDDEIIDEKVKQFVLDCYGENGVKHLGDRNFGYFVKHKLPAYSTTKQYTEAWTSYIGKYEPRDNCKYISDPSHWKNISEIDATLKSLERIENFYLAFMQEDSPIIKNIQRDKSKLQELKN